MQNLMERMDIEMTEPNTADSVELRECPCCGNEATLTNDEDFVHAYTQEKCVWQKVECEFCGLSTLPHRENQTPSAIDTWNRRTHPAAGGEELTDAEIHEIVKAAVSEGRLSWLGYDQDEDGRYTIPSMSPYHYQLARAIERALSNRTGVKAVDDPDQRAKKLGFDDIDDLLFTVEGAAELKGWTKSQGAILADKVLDLVLPAQSDKTVEPVGEYICSKCHLRQDAHTKEDPKF